MRQTGAEMLFKLISYKGSVAGKWHTPRTKKQLGAAMKKLVKFYYRCRDTHLLLPDVVAALKAYASKLEELGFLLIVEEQRTPELFDVLVEIEKLEPEQDLTGELVEEKERIHEQNTCSICRVPLVYPAYIVWRRGLVVEKKSPPIGIMCLNARVKKLNDLVVAVQVVIDEKKPKPVEPIVEPTVAQ